MVRDLQHTFNPSKLFAPWIKQEETARERESSNQQKKRKAKKIQVKIGHGGTLDPLATGVLIAGVGKGTKALSQFLLCTKTYEAVILFGATTDTYDRVGKVISRNPHSHITRELVEEKMNAFRGKYMQLPPLFSALKMNGKPLYEYAREGKEIPRDIERRPVDVHELELLEWMEPGTHEHKIPEENAGHAEINIASRLWAQEKAAPATAEVPVNNEEALANFESSKRKLGESQDDLVGELPEAKRAKAKPAAEAVEAVMSGGLQPEAESEIIPAETSKPSPSTLSTELGPPAARIRMTVTSGFYVRSLCHDLGAAVGSGGLMAELVRTRQGQFELGKNVLEYEDLGKGEEVWGPKVEGMIDLWVEEQRPVVREQKQKTPVVEEQNAKVESTEAKTEEVLVKAGENEIKVEAEVKADAP